MRCHRGVNVFLMPPAIILLLLTLPHTVLGQDDFDEDDFFELELENEDTGAMIADPFEGLNRMIFQMNDVLYRTVLKPVTVTYRHVPRPARVSVMNFFNNLGTPVSALNALLQRDMANTRSEIARFGINSTVGILGLFDPASKMGLEKDTEDLGQTLAQYDAGHGFYIVVPLLGPSSLRDISSGAVDLYVHPFYRKLKIGEVILVTWVEAQTSLSLDPDTYESLYDEALDPYIFFRSAYVQNRRGAIER